MLRACFDDPLLDVMKFLNEIVTEFPSAVSFAPGRPLDAMCRTRDAIEFIEEPSVNRLTSVSPGLPDFSASRSSLCRRGPRAQRSVR